ncbi:MAG: DUF559 domain-containing protein [Candidatus Absconditabacteria bacterium]|nr:DUF559 domain-containing protein [Candidatus Absconditabacteria bacterium]MDD3868680.1 DUF559 domain-containing protein [Candidatus Absconditabacteria bacterium]MDD4714173.1 DUF559 domain-containing protein [Candidatus Absconditabacteria bacterium]
MQTIISLINLGCTKNLVDSQLLLGRLLTGHPGEEPTSTSRGNIIYSTDPYEPEVELVFLNTCGFISSGREEMFSTIDKLLKKGKYVCIIGCALQYFQSPLLMGKKQPDTSPLGRGTEGVRKHYIDYNPNLKPLARELRNNMTQAEKNLRYHFLSECEYKFQRQKPIDQYIVDFFCDKLQLIIEIDGDSHYEDKAIKHDIRRTKTLEALGFKVIRFTNEEVLTNFEAVCNTISDIRTSPPPPSKGGLQEEALVSQAVLEEQQKRQNILSHPKISNLSRNDLKNVNIAQLLSGYQSEFFADFERLDNPRALTNADQKYEYLKIAEGCNNSCSFCIIPKIRGKQQSLPILAILQEVQNLLSQGVEEIILIAQDSTRYGMDLYGKPQLLELLEAIEQIPGDFRYRVLYLYPDILTLNHLKKLTTFKKFIPYFDIPLQHISSPLLKSMGRFYDEQAIYEFLDFIKANFLQHFIRTNFIIGFPGETEQDVKLLHNFLDKDYFDNIALFEYHDEPLAPSSHLPNKIPDHLIHERFLPLRRKVNQLLLAKQHSRKGQKTEGYIHAIHPNKKGNYLFEVRPCLHCPEIDELDEISLEQIIACGDEDLMLASKIEYVV